MIKSFFKTAWRNMVRQKKHAAINVAGLALGLACCMLIFLWVQDERGIDNFHKNGKRLYVFYETVTADGKLSGTYSSPRTFDKGLNFLIEGVNASVPQIQNIGFYATGYELPWGKPETFEVGEKKVKMEGSRASSNFFKTFSYPLVEGNAETALKAFNSIAISRKMADIFFGSPANAMGKTMRYENKLDFTVTSVFEDVTSQSSLKFDFLLNWEMQKRGLEWSSNDFTTYLLLSPTADVRQVEAGINAYLKPRLPNTNGVQIKAGLQPFGDQYLYGNFVNGVPSAGRITYVKIFSGVAIFILIIACINFMNLATARSIKRAKEVGVKKVVGATRGYLISQFFAESLLFSFLAMLAAIIIVLAALPAFNQFTGKQFGFPLAQPTFWAALVTLALVTGLLAGSYPALYLSALKPVKVLKGAFRVTSGAVWLRKGLTIFQFALSIILIIATIVITRQTSFVQTMNLGYDRENLLYMRIEGELAKKDKYLLFKHLASAAPGVAMVDRTTEVPHSMDFLVTDDEITWQGKPKNSTVGVKPASVGFDFVKLMKLQMAYGRDFSPAIASDSNDAYLVNEEAVKEMGMKNPIGQWVQAWDKKGHIIGVLKDFHTQSLHEAIKPILLDVKEGEYFGVILVRTRPGQTDQAIKSLADVNRQLNPAYPFSFQFVDEEYAKMYNSEQIISKLSVVFATVAIAISCLGLLGLVMFSAEQRVKEFGVRKVLGASLSQLVALFAQDFMRLVLIAFLIAAPLGWFGMNGWLQDFAYRINISWWVFALAGISAGAIALLTLVYQAFKTANANPVKSLRTE